MVDAKNYEKRLYSTNSTGDKKVQIRKLYNGFYQGFYSRLPVHGTCAAEAEHGATQERKTYFCPNVKNGFSIVAKCNSQFKVKKSKHCKTLVVI